MDPSGPAAQQHHEPQQQPPPQQSFSPTNPFSGMSDGHQAVPDDMAGAAARLANLQLGSAGGSSSHGTPVHVSAPTRSFNAGASYAPGYGPAPVNYGGPAAQPPQQQLQHPPSFQQQQQQQQHPPHQPLPALVGPMLQFVDVELERALWHGSVLVATNEAFLAHRAQASAAAAGLVGGSTHAGPAAVAGGGAHAPVIEVWDDPHHGPGAGKPKTFTAQAIYTEPTFQYTFWRADVTLALPQESEVDVAYQVYWAADEAAVQSHSARATYAFRLPAQASQWRMCVTSNAQFGRRVPDAARAALRGSGPVFRDLVGKHRANPFHVWLGTGGQFSGEGVWDDCEAALRPFLAADAARRPHVAWTADMAAAVERWYLLEYLRQWFGVGVSPPLEQEAQALFAQAAATMPYSFTADSEIFPCYGSYVHALHFSPVFAGIRHVGARYFALFQAHTTPALAHSEHGFLAEGFHSVKKLGPYTALLTLDTRTERQPAGIIDRHAYDALFAELDARVPPTAANLIVVSSNPVIFPRTKNFEALLRSASSAGLTSIISYAVNGKQARNDWVMKDRFGEPVAVTKLNDFWTSALHKSERAFLVRNLQDFSRRRSCRVTFVSGHVDCLSAAHFRTYTDSKFDPRRYPEQRGFASDFRSMIQLTVSGLVQEPADSLTLRAYHFAGKSAPFDLYTEEKMYHTFTADVNRLPPPNNNQKLLGRRSYSIIIENDFDNDRQRPGLLSFFYVENEACTGTVMLNMINVPPLHYPQLPPGASPVGGGAMVAPVPQQQQQQHPPQQGNSDVRPQMRPGMSYRGYTGAGAGLATAAAAGEQWHAEGDDDAAAFEKHGGASAGDPYSYDLPEYANNPSTTPQGQGAAAAPAGAGSPPPYSPVPQDAQQLLPPRTDGTYSSSYEHTAAWVQGSASHTTGSEIGSGPVQQMVPPAVSNVAAAAAVSVPGHHHQQMYAQASQYQQAPPPVSQYQPQVSQPPPIAVSQYPTHVSQPPPPVSQYQTQSPQLLPVSQYQTPPPVSQYLTPVSQQTLPVSQYQTPPPQPMQQQQQQPQHMQPQHMQQQHGPY
ncbi:hypothetical protein GGI04_003894 [Coemansia thaxteri]|nr:hypothetical protein GGI04_003894 [Coemansia thaxteri]